MARASTRIFASVHGPSLDWLDRLISLLVNLIDEARVERSIDTLYSYTKSGHTRLLPGYLGGYTFAGVDVAGIDGSQVKGLFPHHLNKLLFIHTAHITGITIMLPS